MDKRLEAELFKAIDKWMNKNCESSEWPDIYIGQNTARLMTEAAVKVFESVVDIQEYLEREGHTK